MEEREALKQTLTDLAQIDEVIGSLQKNLCGENVKPSVADLMRLIEARRELARGLPMPMTMTVQWIEDE